MWLDLVIAIGSGGAGIVCGWFLHAISRIANHDAETTPVEAPGRFDPTPDQIFAVAQQLRTSALRIAADVDAHHDRVQSVNHSLSSRRDPSAEAVATAVNELIEANQALQAQLKHAEKRIHHQTIQIETAERRAQTDSLTQVPNRRAFDEYVRARTENLANRPCTLALIDIDHFKRLNDLHGHLAGDEVLQQVAQILFDSLHAYGLVARIGGEEFAAVLDEVSLSESISLLERARQAIGQLEVRFEGHGLRVTASLGAAPLNPGDTVASWIQRADEGLYQSKNAGRDCGHWMDGATPLRIGSRGTPRPRPTQSVPQVSPRDDLVDKTTSMLQPVATHRTTAPWMAAEVSALRALELQFEELRERDTLGGPMALMAVRLSPLASESEYRALMQVVRSATRGVDRVGTKEPQAVLLCMPGLNQKMAAIKARQILHGADSCGLHWSGSGMRPVGIGIVEVEPMESFASSVSRALQLADQARSLISEAIAVEQKEYLQA
jgi:diguanylate cyclase